MSNFQTASKYEYGKTVVADTRDPHFLVGNRSWSVAVSGNHAVIRTAAIDRFNGGANRVGASLMGFRNGGQHGIWTEYFTNIALSQAGRRPTVWYDPIVERKFSQ